MEDRNEPQANDSGKEPTEAAQSETGKDNKIGEAETTENNKTLPLDDHKTLEQTARDAQDMILYSARVGKEIPEGTITAISDFSAKIKNRSYSTVDQVQFITALSSLSLLIAPVTIDSIRLGKKGGRWVAIVLSIVGVLTLILMITVQVRWVVLSNTYNDILSIGRTLRNASIDIIVVENTISNSVSVAGNITDAPPGTQTSLENSTLNNTVGQIDCPSLRDAEARMTCDKQVIEDQQLLLLAHYKILEDWAFGTFVADASSKPQEPGWFASEEEKAQAKRDLEEWRSQRSAEGTFRREFLLATTAAAISTVSTYILPLLYGLLGTVAFILRSFSTDLRLTLYEPSLLITYLLRLPLGMLAGISVGWLLRFDEGTIPTGFAAISPLALAFVAGYSVELVFTAMDRLIGAFAGDARKAGVS